MAKRNTVNRRTFIATAVGLSAAVMTRSQTLNDKEFRLYVGTYTSSPSKSVGIYLLKFDTKLGQMSEPVLAAVSFQPSFLAVSHNGKYLYAVNEGDSVKTSYVSAFEISNEDGSLRFINRQSSQGAAPCHITITEKDDLVLVANYLGGNVAAFPIKDDGSLQPASDICQHYGKGPNADRQEAPHCHSVILDRSNKFVVVDDLGTDSVVIYSIDRKNGKLTANGESYATKPGSGPRHFKFHPNGKFAFLNCEMSMTVMSLAWDGKFGRLTEIDSLSTLPADYRQQSGDSVADLHVSQDGRFLYVSNRGHDSIASYSIDDKTGKLATLEFIKTGGKGPRNFALDPTGNFLLAANQRSNSLTVFRIDKATGKLMSTDSKATVPTPVCLIFAK